VPGVIQQAEVLQVAGMPNGHQREGLLMNRMQSLLRGCGHSSRFRRDNISLFGIMYGNLKVDI
jgi:hypothetical protein